MIFFHPDADVLRDNIIQSKQLYDLPPKMDYEVDVFVEKIITDLLQFTRNPCIHPSIRYGAVSPYNVEFRRCLPISFDLVCENSTPDNLTFSEFGNAVNAKLTKLGYCIKWYWKIHTLKQRTSLVFVCSCIDIDINQEHCGFWNEGWLGIQMAI